MDENFICKKNCKVKNSRGYFRTRIKHNIRTIRRIYKYNREWKILTIVKYVIKYMRILSNNTTRIFFVKMLNTLNFLHDLISECKSLKK